MAQEESAATKADLAPDRSCLSLMGPRWRVRAAAELSLVQH